MKTNTIRYIAGIECEKERLLKYLFIRLSPLLTKNKPSVLIRYSSKTGASSLTNYQQFMKYQQQIYAALNLEYIELKNSDGELQVMFYDRALLTQNFAEPQTKEFLKNCGYDEKSTVDAKLELLKARFTSNSFPHEIGVFLGYPLKDVKAFSAGRSDFIPLPKSMWKVYDSVEESINKMQLYRKVEAVAAGLAVKYSSTIKCIEKFRTFAGVEARTA